MKIKMTRATIDIKFFCDNSNPSFCAKKKTLYPQWMRGFFFIYQCFAGLLNARKQDFKAILKIENPAQNAHEIAHGGQIAKNHVAISGNIWYNGVK